MSAAGVVRGAGYSYRRANTLSDHSARVCGENCGAAFLPLQDRNRARYSNRLRGNSMGLATRVGRLRVSPSGSSDHRGLTATEHRADFMKVVLDIETVQAPREEC